MAVPQFHITNDDSGSFGTTSPFDETGPGTLLMDADGGGFCFVGHQLCVGP
jgi:hypothetical protein